VLGLALTCLVLFGVAATGASAAPPSGSLSVQVSGLPSGQRPAATLGGPGGLRRSVPARGLTLAHARIGRYELSLGAVRVTRKLGSIKRGAIATALHPRVGVRVIAHRHALLDGSYTSIVNPGVRPFRGGVVSLAGPPDDPSTVVLAGHVILARGAILSVPPSSMLPRGLLSHVLGVSYGPGKTTVSVKAASPY
jgi:hypothetical protein